jgi:hypothetical protein
MTLAFARVKILAAMIAVIVAGSFTIAALSQFDTGAVEAMFAGTGLTVTPVATAIAPAIGPVDQQRVSDLSSGHCAQPHPGCCNNSGGLGCCASGVMAATASILAILSVASSPFPAPRSSLARADLETPLEPPQVSG